MSDDVALRCGVADELSALGDLRTDGARNSSALYEQDFARRKFRRTLISDLLDQDEAIRCDRSAIVTAGVPGAGKSTMLRERVADLAGYRFLDADVVKVSLIERALKDGIYDDLLGVQLGDGHGVAPMELAPLVHRESVDIVEAAREECLRRGENVVVEGTLTWDGHPGELYGELSDAGYRSIVVLVVQVAVERAHQQAVDRWWEGRARWRAGEEALGGRFTPPAAIDVGYDVRGDSVCARNALTFIDLAQSGSVESVAVEIMAPTGEKQWNIVRREQFVR